MQGHECAASVGRALVVAALFAMHLSFGAEKVNIAVFDLQNRGGLTQSEVQIISDRVNSILLRNKTFTVVERQQIEDILKEQGFQQSGACSDQQCLVEVGQLLAVRKIISGSVGKIENLFAVTLKLVDVASGEIEAQETADYKCKKSDLLAVHIPDMTNAILAKAGYAEREAVRKRSLFTRGYFWAPVTVAVGGAAAATYYLLSREEDAGEEVGELPMPVLPAHPGPQ